MKQISEHRNPEKGNTGNEIWTQFFAGLPLLLLLTMWIRQSSANIVYIIDMVTLLVHVGSARTLPGTIAFTLTYMYLLPVFNRLHQLFSEHPPPPPPTPPTKKRPK